MHRRNFLAHGLRTGQTAGLGLAFLGADAAASESSTAFTHRWSELVSGQTVSDSDLLQLAVPLEAQNAAVVPVRLHSPQVVVRRAWLLAEHHEPAELARFEWLHPSGALDWTVQIQLQRPCSIHALVETDDGLLRTQSRVAIIRTHCTTG